MVDDFADEVTGRGEAAAGEVGAELDAVGAAGLGGEGVVEGGAARFERRLFVACIFVGDF